MLSLKLFFKLYAPLGQIVPSSQYKVTLTLTLLPIPTQEWMMNEVNCCLENASASFMLCDFMLACRWWSDPFSPCLWLWVYHCIIISSSHFAVSHQSQQSCQSHLSSCELKLEMLCCQITSLWLGIVSVKKWLKRTQKGKMRTVWSVLILLRALVKEG